VEAISSLSICDHLICILYVSRRQCVAVGWKVRESNPGLDENFGTRPGRPLDPPSLRYNGLCVIPGRVVVKWPNRGIDHPSPSSAEIKERVCCTSVPSGPSWPVLGKLHLLRKLITCTNVVWFENIVSWFPYFWTWHNLLPLTIFSVVSCRFEYIFLSYILHWNSYGIFVWVFDNWMNATTSSEWNLSSKIITFIFSCGMRTQSRISEITS
jgi:hypothetical protein